ncbi:MAG TPA: SH3 domain-containing protein [Bacilli bacterium]
MKKKSAILLLMVSMFLSMLPNQILAYMVNVQNAVVLESVNFRTEPSLSGSRIRYLSVGERLLLISKVNESWYKLKDKNGRIGYASTLTRYIRIETISVKAEPNATVVKSVSFRTGPSTGYANNRYLQSGEALYIIDKVNEYWYKAEDKNLVIGYVSTSTQYISTTYVEPYKLMDPEAAAQKAIDAGMKYLGTPYEFGSSRQNTSTFDCSDFVRQAYLDGIGMKLPGDSRGQGDLVKQIGKTSSNWHYLKKGDLVFFMSYKGYKPADYESINKSTETITHTGIYIGNGQILHTFSVASGGVQITNLADSTWELRFLFGGTPL